MTRLPSVRLTMIKCACEVNSFWRRLSASTDGWRLMAVTRNSGRCASRSESCLTADSLTRRPTFDIVLLFFLLGLFFKPLDIHQDAGAHRAGKTQAADQPSLDGAGTRPHNRLHGDAAVLGELLRLERTLADHEMDVGQLFHLELDLALLELLDHLGNVLGDRSRLRVWHQAAGP